jgi:hypothetical protein
MEVEIKRSDVSDEKIFQDKGQDLVDLIVRILHTKNIALRGFLNIIYRGIVWLGVGWSVQMGIFGAMRDILIKNDRSFWWPVVGVFALIASFGAANAVVSVMEKKFKDKYKLI